jgi:TM2 domain-containing membrane protein YozV
MAQGPGSAPPPEGPTEPAEQAPPVMPPSEPAPPQSSQPPPPPPPQAYPPPPPQPSSAPPSYAPPPPPQYQPPLAQGGYVAAPHAVAPTGYVVAPKSPAVAVLISFFFPGVGSLISGGTTTGTIILIGWLVSIPLLFFCIGFFTYTGFWIWGMFDAYTQAQKWNREHGIIS